VQIDLLIYLIVTTLVFFIHQRLKTLIAYTWHVIKQVRILFLPLYQFLYKSKLGFIETHFSSNYAPQIRDCNQTHAVFHQLPFWNRWTMVQMMDLTQICMDLIHQNHKFSWKGLMWYQLNKLKDLFALFFNKGPIWTSK